MLENRPNFRARRLAHRTWSRRCPTRTGRWGGCWDTALITAQTMAARARRMICPIDYFLSPSAPGLPVTLPMASRIWVSAMTFCKL